MLILTIRTDKPEAEIGLYDDQKQLAYQTWTAHRQLAETLHGKILDILASNGRTLNELQGVACFSGPGSFTGLRIGLTVANALAYALEIPIVAAAGDDWQTAGIETLLDGGSDLVALPEYGADAFVTTPKR